MNGECSFDPLSWVSDWPPANSRHTVSSTPASAYYRTASAGNVYLCPSLLGDPDRDLKKWESCIGSASLAAVHCLLPCPAWLTSASPGLRAPARSRRRILQSDPRARCGKTPSLPRRSTPPRPTRASARIGCPHAAFAPVSWSHKSQQSPAPCRYVRRNLDAAAPSP